MYATVIVVTMRSTARPKVIEKFTQGDVLDVGCVQHTAENESENTWLHQYIYDFEDVEEVIGIDILEEDVKQLQERGYNVEVQNAEEIDFERKFDTIIAGEIIEHVSNPGKLLKSASNHLSTGGHLIITTPNTFNILRFLFFIKNGYVSSNDEHTGWYDPQTLKQLASRYNLSPEYIQKYTFENELEYTDYMSDIIRMVSPSAWTAETIIAVFTKMPSRQE